MGGNLQVMPASNLITSLTSSNLSCKINITRWKALRQITLVLNNETEILQLTGKSVKAIPKEKNLHIILL